MYSGKTVVITGGANGIGAALVSAYIDIGATVFALDIDSGSHPKCEYISVDLADKGQVTSAFHRIHAEYGAAHVLINNGAITRFHKPVAELHANEFSHVVNVNLIAAFACVKAFIDVNKGQSYGRIINIASTRWAQNEPGWDAYGASKGGLVSLTNSLVNSLAETPITVNTISPGWIETEDYAALRECDHEQHPSGRVGKPSDIVNACLFLTHEDNDFVNGANIVVDGGMTKKMIYHE